MTLLDDRALDTGDYVILTYQCDTQSKEVCEVDCPAGNWWYALNDGLLDVGPFISKEAAIQEATRQLDYFKTVMGGRVRSVSIAVFQ